MTKTFNRHPGILGPRDIPSLPGESQADWRLRVERVLGIQKPQELDEPIPPRFGPCGEGLPIED